MKGVGQILDLEVCHATIMACCEHAVDPAQADPPA
jgi:hypothetical protein